MTTSTVDTTRANTGAAPDATVDTSRTLGIASLVLGLASIAFGFPMLVPIAAMVIGAIGLSHGPAGRNYRTWGIIAGVVSLALPVIALGFDLAFLAPCGVFALLFGH